MTEVRPPHPEDTQARSFILAEANWFDTGRADRPVKPVASLRQHHFASPRGRSHWPGTDAKRRLPIRGARSLHYSVGGPVGYGPDCYLGHAMLEEDSLNLRLAELFL